MAAPAQSGVQSVTRALDLLEVVAAAGGQLSISEIGATAGLPLPTIHRLIRTLVDRGYMRQLPNRRYALGSRLIPLGEVAEAMLGTWATPVLERIVDELGESTNLAVLDGDLITYVGQVPSRHSMRMFTEVGRKVFPHCTGVGKAVLTHLTDDQIRALLARTGMPAQTPHTITDPDQFVAAVQQARRDGYAMDEGEQELGVRCVAVPVPGARSRMAVSVSGPAPRMTPELVHRAIPLLCEAGRVLAAEFAERASA
jgi:IclR family acetate operon transcriptional repressor